MLFLYDYLYEADCLLKYAYSPLSQNYSRYSALNGELVNDAMSCHCFAHEYVIDIVILYSKGLNGNHSI